VVQMLRMEHLEELPVAVEEVLVVGVAAVAD
jgi:hypothetical protein